MNNNIEITEKVRIILDVVVAYARSKNYYPRGITDKTGTFIKIYRRRSVHTEYKLYKIISDELQDVGKTIIKMFEDIDNERWMEYDYCHEERSINPFEILNESWDAWCKYNPYPTIMGGRAIGKTMAQAVVFKNGSTIRCQAVPIIDKVIFNDPATIVFWADGSKTVVKCQNGDVYDPEKGLAMAIVKKALGNQGNYCNEIKKWLPEDKKKKESEVLGDVVSTDARNDGFLAKIELAATEAAETLKKRLDKGLRGLT